MFSKILIGLVVVVGLFLVYVSFQPSRYTIAREITVHAPPEVVFPYINNSQKANDWMPWQDEDPTVVMQYEGVEEGVGSISTWNSEGKMGVGKAEVVESIENEKVTTQLTYTKPMQMSQQAVVSLTPVDVGTLVKWEVTGENNFMGKVFCIFVNMDKMVGDQFEKGLQTLKQRLESRITE